MMTLYQQIQSYLCEHDVEELPLWLCTVVRTYGSSPRPVGSLFLTDGKFRIGSISGGCLEQHFLNMLPQLRPMPRAFKFSYGGHLSAASNVELPCGGTIDLLIEYIDSHAQVNDILHFLDQIIEGKPLERSVSMPSGKQQLQPIGSNLCRLHGAQVAYKKPYQLLILGASSVAEKVCELALANHFMVRVCDFRESFIDGWTGDALIDVMSPDSFIDKYCHEQTAVLALAHDPRVDDLGLMAALENKPHFIGAIGSKNTTKARCERFQRCFGFSEDTLSSIHMPIGFDIGSKTPISIAIAIMAQLIAHQHGKNHYDYQRSQAKSYV